MDDLADRDVEQLSTELAWIRRLAYAIVKDADVADDISQEAWLAARRSAPGDRPLRPWLARVIRNLVRMQSRSDVRREHREAAVAGDTCAPASDELVDRVAMQRALADAVLALSEPYRSTVLLHYFEGLSSAEIARRLEIPDGTVRRRLKFALDELRAHFERRDRRGLFALAPLIAGNVTMKKSVLVIAAVVLMLLAVVGSVWWSRRERPAERDTQAGVAGASRAAGTGGHDRASSLPPDQAPWFTQRDVAGRRIAGRVLSQGVPLPGAVVRLANVTSEARGPRAGDELEAVTSGTDGSFDFGVQPAAMFLVSAEADDKTPAAIAIATMDPRGKPASDALVLELGPCRARLYGSIVDASGGGIAKARLAVKGLGGAEASATGEYSLCVPMGDSRVRIVADGYGAVELPIHLVGAHHRDFELVPEAVLAGIVIDEAGKGVPYAQVLALPQAIEQPHFLGDGSAVADASGHFRIANLAPGRFMLAARADGYGSSAPKPAIAAPGEAAELTLVVGQRARVSGTVMMKGTPVAGARIATQGPLLLASVSYSQQDGTFTLDNVPFGALPLTAGDFEVVTPAQIVVDKPVVDKVVIEVSERASLRGRVLRKGAPIADALVQSFNGASARSDATGHYEMRGLPPGDIQIFAQVFGEISAFAPAQLVKIAKGTPTEHDIELTGAATVSGTVIDESGAPVPNVYVRLIDPKGDLGESMTDGAGAFTCTSMLGGGDYRAAVFPSPGARTAFPAAGGGSYESIAIADGDTVVRDIKIAIKNERLSIAGRVVDDAGSPIADVHVEAIGRGFGGNPAMLPSVRADAGGTFVIGDLARGTYALHAHAADGSEVELADVASGTTGVVLHLIRPGTIEGTVAGFAKTPRVHARQVTAELRVGNEAILDGNHYTISGLTPGTYIVEALAGDQSAGQSVVVKPGAVLTVNLEGRGRGSVRGTVTERGTKSPVRGMSCFAAQSRGGQAGDIPQGTPTASNTTDAAGAFDIPAPIGRVRVMCFSADGTTSVAGGDTDVTEKASGTITLETVRAVPPPSDVGFRIKPLTLPLVIASVDPGGPAKTGGLAVGDIVTSLDGAPVAGLLPGGAMMVAWNHRIGTTLVIGVERAGTPMSIKVIARAPAN
jgi:RNA polymerase sigma-70 factor (ECF subfamily)